jgi:hypothetical protein
MADAVALIDSSQPAQVRGPYKKQDAAEISN